MTKMKRYKIEGQILKVEEKPLSDVAGQSAYGDYRKNHIRVDSRMPSYQRRWALLHELGHFVSDRGVITDRFETAAEELICDEFATWLLAINEAAPELIDEIFAR